MSPIDPDAFPSFSRYFSQIVTRYRDTITGQFYGHSHYDEFHVFYDDKEIPDGVEPQPHGVAYVAPSVTPYGGLNPAFRVYEVDKRTKQVVNHRTYSMDLVEANRNGKSEWKLLYDAKSAYGLPDLSAQSWHDLTEKFLKDQHLFTTYTSRATRRASQDRKFPKCHIYETATQCRERMVCKLRGSSKHRGPWANLKPCHMLSWLPDIPDEWFTEMIIGKDVDVVVDADETVSTIEEDGVSDSLPKQVVRMVAQLLMGGGDAVCK